MAGYKPFKMRGNPFKRNFGIGADSPMQDKGKHPHTEDGSHPGETIYDPTPVKDQNWGADDPYHGQGEHGVDVKHETWGSKKSPAKHKPKHIEKQRHEGYAHEHMHPSADPAYKGKVSIREYHHKPASPAKHRKKGKKHTHTKTIDKVRALAKTAGNIMELRGHPSDYAYYKKEYRRKRAADETPAKQLGGPYDPLIKGVSKFASKVCKYIKKRKVKKAIRASAAGTRSKRKVKHEARSEGAGKKY